MKFQEKTFVFFILISIIFYGKCTSPNQKEKQRGKEVLINSEVDLVKHPPDNQRNANYPNNIAPLSPQPMTALPMGSIKPLGWLKKKLQLAAQGYPGKLEEISLFLRENNNAWLSPEGKGIHGWEEVPYWLRGYLPLAYLVDDQEMIENAHEWIEPILLSDQENGWFGPGNNLEYHDGSPSLMPNLFIQYALEDYYEKTGDNRVIDLMLNYCRFLKDLPEEKIFLGGWAKTRGVEKLHHIYWLYNRTEKSWLLDLAEKIQQQGTSWLTGKLESDHSVNIAEGMREPATFWQQSHQPEHLEATYSIYNKLYDKYEDREKAI